MNPRSESKAALLRLKSRKHVSRTRLVVGLSRIGVKSPPHPKPEIAFCPTAATDANRNDGLFFSMIFGNNLELTPNEDN